MGWEVKCFPSGTMIVKDQSLGKAPHFYVHGPGDDDEVKTAQNRLKVCQDIALWMNGGTRPKWLDDLERNHPEGAGDLDGTSISATGPSIDIDPPNRNWRIDMSPEAVKAREQLIDQLFRKG